MARLPGATAQFLPTIEEVQKEVEDGLDLRTLLFRFLAKRLDVFDDLVAFRSRLFRDVFQVVENTHEIYRKNDEANREKHDGDSGNEEENVCMDEGGHRGSIAQSDDSR